MTQYLRVVPAVARASMHASPVLSMSASYSSLERVRSQDEMKKIKADCIASPKTVSIVGAPMTYGQPYLGAESGPERMRKGGLHKILMNLDWRVKELGNLMFQPPSDADPEYDGPGRVNVSYAVGTANQKLRDVAADQAKKGRFVLTLGGDHSVGLGSVAGILTARPETGVIWVDAHADINTPEISPSGNTHGMPVAFLMKLIDHTKVPGMQWLSTVPTLKREQIVYIALRDVDDGERALLRTHNIKAFTMQHVDRYGIGKVCEMALDHLSNRTLHLSFDIDSCDPAIAPSTGTTVRGGLTFREAHFVAEAISDSGRLASMDMVEVNPNLTTSNGTETVEIALNLIGSAMGQRIL